MNITVEDTNDNPPKFEPGSPVVNVSEAVAIGTKIISFNATDKDSESSLTFRITAGNVDDTFEIDESTGVLTTKKGLDRETVPRYNLTVNVTDSGGRSSSRDLTVIVTDENDNVPRFDPTSYPVDIVENTNAGTFHTDL